jgi:pSer/pThr/pTyr-binding forkhead associated (FHA) protein
MAAEPLEQQEPKELEEPEPLEASEPEKIDAEEAPPEPTIFSFDTSEKNSEPPSPEPEITPFLPTPTPYIQSPATPRIGQGRYYMVFVNTPAQSLIKSKVPIEFDDFPVVSIGRSPENVVVIPDQEVSRKHAELTMDGAKLMLKDLNSKNGTFLYNGKEFQQVHDSVEVKPNSIVKFGTGTIVRLTSE